MLLRLLIFSIGLAAQPDIGESIRKARAEEVRGHIEPARKLLELAAAGCGKNGNRQTDECMQVLLDLSELVADPTPLLDFAARAEASQTLGAEAAMRRGFLHVSKKEFKDAEASFAVAERRDAGQAARSAIWIAIAQTRGGHLDEAERQIQSAIAKARPEETAGIAGVAAMLYDEMGRGDDAAAMRKRMTPVSSVPRPLPPPGTVRVSASVSAPKLQQRVQPRYSVEARTAKYQGNVMLTIVVDETGVPRDIRVVRGLGMGLDERATAAVAEWRFKPGMRGDAPVAVFATIEVNFRLL